MPPITPVVKNMIIINVVVFLLLSFSPANIQNMMLLHDFPSGYFQPFQFVSTMFTHISPSHIFFNMLTLFFFGPLVENRLGTKKTFIAYMSGGLIASIAFFLFFSFVAPQQFSLLGASGAVFTIITLAALYYPNMKAGILFLPFQIPLKYLAMIFIAIDLFSFGSGANTGIAHLAHLGGAAVGFVLYYIWEKR